MTDRTLDILINFGLSREQQGVLKKNLDELRSTMAKLRSETDATRSALQKAMAEGSKDAPKLQAKLENIEKTLRDIETQARDTFGKQYVQAAKASAEQTQQLAERIGRVGVALGALGGAGVAAFAAYASKYAQYAGAAEKAGSAYLQTSRRIEQANLRLGRVAADALNPWRDALADILEKAAQAAEQNPGTAKGLLAGAFVAAGSGAALAGASQVLKIVADVKFLSAAALQNVAADKMLKAAGIQAGAAARGGIGGALGAIPLLGSLGGAAIIGGAAAFTAGVGYLGYNAIRNNTEYGKKLNPDMVEGGLTAGAQGLTALAGGLGLLTDKIGLTDGAAKRWGVSIGELTGAIKGAEEAGKNVLSAEAVQAFADYSKAAEQAQEDYAARRNEIESQNEERRNQIVQSYGEQRAQLEDEFEQRRTEAIRDYQQERSRDLEDYERSRAQAEADFQRSQAEAAKAYYEQRSQLQGDLQRDLAEQAKAHQEAMVDAEKNYRKQLEDLEKDHAQRMTDLVANRDALGIVQESRDYERQKDELKTNYQEQLADLRANFKEQQTATRENYAQQLDDLQSNYKAQAEQRQEEFERQQAEQQEEFEIRRERETADFQARLRQMDEEHAQRMEQAEQQFQEQLEQSDTQSQETLAQLDRQYQLEKTQRETALKSQLQSMLGIEEQGYSQMRDAAQRYVDDLLAEASRLNGEAGGEESRAFGGYASYGRYKLGDGGGPEYVLNANTTRMAEKVIGGRLSQEALLMALGHRSNANASNVQNLSVSIPVGGGVLAMQERRKIVGEAGEAAISAFSSALGAI